MFYLVFGRCAMLLASAGRSRCLRGETGKLSVIQNRLMQLGLLAILRLLGKHILWLFAYGKFVFLFCETGRLCRSLLTQRCTSARPIRSNHRSPKFTDGGNIHLIHMATFKVPLVVKWLGFSAAAGSFGYFYAFDSRAAMHRLVSMPLVRFLLDAEQSHTFTVMLSKYGLVPRDRRPDHSCLYTELFQGRLKMSNPVGIGAGFDKHGEAMDGLFSMGFGMVELGSVTPVEQPGNPKPRLFRLEEDEAAINRFGFNSVGHGAVESRVRSRFFDFLSTLGSPHSSSRDIAEYQGVKSFRSGRVLGVNLGKNKTSPADSNSDYIKGVERLGPYADYVVVNVSSPNTPGLRDLQRKEVLKKLMVDVKVARDSLNVKMQPVLIVKIAPDLSDSELKDVAEIVQEVCIDGVIIGNTTISRPASLLSSSEKVCEKGGLSGKPLKPIALEKVRTFYKLTQGKVPIIGCGGISNGQDALDYIEAGASALQLYTAMAYQGPGVVGEIKDYLTQVCTSRNLDNIQSLVGSKANN